MKLLEIQPTRLLLNVTGLAMFDSVPLPQPSPQSQHSPSTTSRFSSLHIAQLLSAFLLQNTVYVNEAFTSYPLCLSIKITWFASKLDYSASTEREWGKKEKELSK